VKDIVNEAEKEPPEKIIPWMTDDLRASFKNKREIAEGFKKKNNADDAERATDN